MAFLVLLAFLALIPAAIAHAKGRSFFGWWLYGCMLLIVALPHAILAKPSRRGLRQCPHCAEWIGESVAVCRCCGRDVAEAAKPVAYDAPAAKQTFTRACGHCGGPMETWHGQCDTCGSNFVVLRAV
jgi:hypothetical protein